MKKVLATSLSMCVFSASAGFSAAWADESVPAVPAATQNLSAGTKPVAVIPAALAGAAAVGALCGAVAWAADKLYKLGYAHGALDVGRRGGRDFSAPGPVVEASERTEYLLD